MTREQLGVMLGSELSEVGSGLGPVYGGPIDKSNDPLNPFS